MGVSHPGWSKTSDGPPVKADAVSIGSDLTRSLKRIRDAVWPCMVNVDLSFFFFSSRRRHTRFDCDWSSDCSSDLIPNELTHGTRLVSGSVQIDLPARSSRKRFASSAGSDNWRR